MFIRRDGDMRENLKVLDTKFNKVICLMALVKNQRYSKNSKNNVDDPQVLILKIGLRSQRLRYYRHI